MLEICCSSISGGYFVSQVAIITMLMEVRSRSKINKKFFDIYFGASGGNLANIISTCFEDTKESIERILYSLESKIFVKNWWKGKARFLDSKILFLFKNTFYDSGDNIYDVLKKLINEDHFLSKEIPEIWTLTFNSSKSKPTIFCNLNEEDSYFKDDTIKDDLQELETKFLSGDLEKISKTMMASASVPGVKSGVEIDEEKHVDGGVASPTPYYYFSKLIEKKCKDNFFTPPYHFFYLLPHGKQKKESDTVQDSSFTEILINNLQFTIFKDKTLVFDSWLKIINKSQENLDVIKESNISKKKLLEILDSNYNNDYFAIFYTDTYPINITNFGNVELEFAFNKTYSSIHLELFINKN